MFPYATSPMLKTFEALLKPGQKDFSTCFTVSIRRPSTGGEVSDGLLGGVKRVIST